MMFILGLLDFLLDFLLGATAEVLWVIIDWKSAFSLQRGQLDPKFKVEGSPPPTIFVLTKLEYMIFHMV